MKIYIVGAGNFGKEVHGWMTLNRATIAGYIDDIKPNAVKIADYKPQTDDQLLVAISSPHDREIVVEMLTKDDTVFHQMLLCTPSPTAKVGIGNVWCPLSLVSAGASIGNFVHVNVMSSVGHDVELGDFCTLASHVDIMGHVKVGRRVFFGSGCRVMPNVTIGDDAVIGAGAIVVKDVPAGATIYAQPGRTL